MTEYLSLNVYHRVLLTENSSQSIYLSIAEYLG